MGKPVKHVEVGYGAASGEDSFSVGRQAARLAMEGISAYPLSAVIVFASVRYDLPELLAGVGSVVGNVAVFGSTTAGEICNEALQESVVITTVASLKLRVRIGLGRDVSADWQKALGEAVEATDIKPYFSGDNTDIWTSLTRQGISVFAMLFSPGNTRHADSRSFEILEQLKQLSNGRIPFFGGSAADDWKMEGNYVLYGRKAHPDSLLVAIFETSLRFGISMGHGFSPSGRRAVATKVSGHEVVELDGRRAADVYAKMLGNDLQDLKGKHLTLSSGRPTGTPDVLNQYRINAASYFTAEGGIRFAQPVSENSTIAIMETQPDKLIEASKETLRKAVVQGAIRRPAAALVFPCALRRQILNERAAEEISELHSVLPEIPILGFYSFGEQGINDVGVSCHGNEAITALVLGDELLASAEVALENHRLLKLQREAEKSFKESEERFRAVFESTSDFVFLKDMDRRYVMVNPAVARLFKRPPEELVGWTDTELFGEEAAGHIEKEDVRVLKGETVEAEHSKPVGGRLRTFHVKKTPVRGPDGTVVGLCGIARDITKRKQAEEALQESEERHRLFFENAPIGITYCSPDGVITSVNKAAVNIFGSSEKELIGLSVGKIPHNQLSKEVMRSLQGECGHYEGWYTSYTGGKRAYIKADGFPIIVDGQVKSGVGIIEDITDRKNAEIEIQQSRELLLTILNSIDATIYVADMGTHEILFMNKNMVDVFGADLTGQICWKAFRGESGPCSFCTNKKLIDVDGKPNGVQVWQGRNPVNGRHYLNYDRAIRWADGRIVKIQIATDISELKRMEAELRQTHKMRAIGILAGGIAHDFNNILSVIFGFTELALDDAKKGTLLAESLQEIFIASRRAKDLVGQILTFARQSDEENKPIQVGPIAKEVLKFIRSSIPTTIEIRQDIRSRSLIMGNNSQIQQVFMSLCTNAAHAMEEEGGVLQITLKDVLLQEPFEKLDLNLPPGSYLQITVSDTGTGIAPQTKDAIFEPYFTTKGVGRGTGMGLAVVYGIVESYGGKIIVDSEVGKGTTFTLYLPITKKQEDSHPHESRALPAGTERILFVDDEVPIANISSRLLETLGYKVVAMTDSLEALAFFEEKPNDFDLVITDMTMPNISGDKLAAELMRIRPDIPVILCTGYSNRISEEKAAEIGIKAFAYKPMVKEELAKTVRSVLDETRGPVLDRNP